jgi:hypothetical protein
VACRARCLTGAIGTLCCRLSGPDEGVSGDATLAGRRAETGSANAAPHPAPPSERQTRKDGTAMRPHASVKIAGHHRRVPAPHVLRELACVLALEDDTLGRE